MDLNNLKHDFERNTKGISIHGLSLNGYILSIQAGEFSYSEPKSKTEEYNEVEFALCKDKDRKFIRDDRINPDDDVVGYADFDSVMNAINVIESWVGGRNPFCKENIRNEYEDMGTIRKSDAPWKDIN